MLWSTSTFHAFTSRYQCREYTMSVAKIIKLATLPLASTHSSVSAINYMPVYATAKYGESQANSSSRLKTRGLHRYNSTNVASFSKFKNPESLEKNNPISGATVTLVKA